MTNISKSFGGVTVLQNVQLDLFTGEVHVLAGENGAGKSTLINILGGVHRDYDGQIRLGANPVRCKSVLDAAHHGIAVIHQELSLVDSLSVVDNMFLGREPHRWSWLRRRAMRVLGRQWLGALDLDIDLNCPVEQFPVGIKQMIEDCKTVIEVNPDYDHAGAYRMMGGIYTKLPQTGGNVESITRNLPLAEEYLKKANI